MKQTIFGLWAALAAVAVVRAQEPTNEAFESPAATPSYAEVMSSLDQWRAENGAAWQLKFEKETMNGRFLYGGSASAPFVAPEDQQWTNLAYQAVANSAGMHRIAPSTLVPDSVVFLPLGNAGTTDKMTVQFRQEVRGVPVIQGFVSALFDMQGRLLSVDSTALPEAQSLSTSPSIDDARAYDIALKQFVADTGFAPTSAENLGLAIDGVLNGKFKQPTLVWRMRVLFEPQSGDAEGYEYRVDARTGRIAAKENAIHHDVSGNVKSITCQTNKPDTAAWPLVQTNLTDMVVTSGSGNATTDLNGNFNIVGATAPLTATFKFVGPWATVVNSAGAAYTLAPSLTGASGNNVLLNSPSTALVTAQANAFLQINAQRDWTRAVVPADALHDFLATANVNIASTCNAYYNGTSVNFYQAGGGCVNTSYGDVVSHEMGHWMNVKYGSGNGSDGFGEGNADVFANYFFDDPVLGRDFQGSGSYIRTGLNTRMFCGDANPGCYGEVHNDGEVLMGAMWKVRARLKTSLGVAAGGAAANTLFFSWMNAYNDGQIKTIVETHWLTLDDNDGNIGNGTPHYADIEGGFRDQGFPAIPLSFVTFSNVTQLPSTQDQYGPYVVNANVVAVSNPPLTTVSLKYRINGGAYATVPMTFVSGTSYTASIPGQPCPTSVDYYLTGTNSAAGTNVYPDGAPASALNFTVGNTTVLYAQNFESGVAGWTHGLVSGQDDWQISSQFPVNTSYGKVGDPTVAASGTNIWGNDLGPTGWNGAYGANTNNWLRSPTINCSGSVGVHLKFKRWLQVENSVYDHARVRINGTQVWENSSASDLLDTSWNAVDLNISAIADNNPSVQIEFSMQSDAGLQYCGWNIDDVEVSYQGACAPICPAASTYCVAKLTSNLTIPAIGSTGLATVTANNFVVTLDDAMPNAQSVCFWSSAANNTPFKGGTLCAAQPLNRTPATTTNALGHATFAVPVDVSMVGSVRKYQWWFRDPPDPFTIGLSDGLSATFCN